MTAAVRTVQIRQNELALHELGNNPELRASEGFVVQGKTNKPYFNIPEFSTVSEEVDDDELALKFKKMLNEISESYSQFPLYLLEIMAENYAIPLLELKFLLKNFQKEGYLIRLEGNLYKINP